MPLTRAEMTPLKLGAMGARARQIAAERAFNECPSWRPFKRSRLCEHRTFWRLLAEDEQRAWLASLPLDEAMLAVFELDTMVVKGLEP